jgi:hypothetical protein
VKLIVHELQDEGLTQTLVPDKRINVVAMRPHLYRHQWPDGSLKVQIKQGATLIAESEAQPISEIGTEDYFHGYVRFYVNAILEKDVEYSFILISDDGDPYEFSEPAYIGWCNGFDLLKYEATYDPSLPSSYPLDMEIWSRKFK